VVVLIGQLPGGGLPDHAAQTSLLLIVKRTALTVVAPPGVLATTTSLSV
jgi:hypothetical protein